MGSTLSCVPQQNAVPSPVDINLIMQSNFLTSASYNFSKIQRDIFVHIREELQVYLGKTPEDFLSLPEIQVPLFIRDYPHFDGKTKQFYDYVVDMAQKKNFISFSYVYSDGISPFIRQLFGIGGTRMKVRNGDTLHMSLSVITGAKYSTGDDSCLMVSVNRMAVPFILYYGAGVGSMHFDRDVSLGFNHSKTSRIYEWLLDWGRKEKIHRMSVAEFRERLCLTKSYARVSNIRDRILDEAREEINASRSVVKFTYDMSYDPSMPSDSLSSSKKAYNVIDFIITRTSASQEVKVHRQGLQVCLQDVADKECALSCREVVDIAEKKGVDYRLRMKFNYYMKRLKEGCITRDEYVNTMLKIVRDMVGVDLRSIQHIRNSKLRAVRQNARIMKEPELISDTLF